MFKINVKNIKIVQIYKFKNDHNYNIIGIISVWKMLVELFSKYELEGGGKYKKLEYFKCKHFLQ